MLENLDLLVNLKRLSVSHNELTDTGCLLDLKKLEYLDITYNQITDINGSFLPSSLKAILIGGNPLKDREALIKRLVDRLPNLFYVDGELVRESAQMDLKYDLAEAPVTKVEQSFLNAKFEESSRDTLSIDDPTGAGASNSTRTLISDAFALDLVNTPVTNAQEAAEKMRYSFLIEHSLFKTEFESKFRPFEDRHPNQSTSRSNLMNGL